MHLRTLLATGVATAAAGALGSVANATGMPGWYSSIRKPNYVPPSPVFPVAWTSLYATIAATSASTIDRLATDSSEAGRATRRAYIAALAVNLGLNASWSWVFFRWHRLGPAAVVAALLAASSADLRRRTAQVDRRSGLALSPYPAWCAFATVMSTDIWRLNRNQRPSAEGP